jgi:HPt (histidine-containing phosphotransfer) domain-containing protein
MRVLRLCAMCGIGTPAVRAAIRFPSFPAVSSPAGPARSVLSPAHMPREGSRIRRAALLARVGGDEEVAAQLCAVFLDDAPKRLDVIAKAVAAGEARALQTAVHALRGAAAVFDADEVVTAAGRIERLAADGDVAAGALVWPELEARSRALLDEIRACRS